MNDRLKKILLIIGFVLITILIGYFLYRLFFRPAAPAPPTGQVTTNPPQGQLPQANQGVPSPYATSVARGVGGLPAGANIPSTISASFPNVERTKVLRENPTQALSLSPDHNGLRAYDAKEGKFYRISPEGKAVALSDQQFYDVERVSWGKQSDKAVLSYPDGSNILYDFQNNKQVTLPRHWEDFDFSPQDDKVAAKSIGNNETNRFLITADPDGTNARPIEDLGDNDDKVHVSWSPSNQIIAYSFTGDPIGFDRQAIVMVGQNHENFKNLIVEGRGFVPNWSPDGQELLYSVYNSQDGYRPTLWISGASGDDINANRTNLQINTWADKCAWQNAGTLICAVPEALEEGAGLQPAIADSVPDQIYKIDLKTGQKINLGEPAGRPNVTQMTVSPDGSAAFFTDRATGKLMRFAL